MLCQPPTMVAYLFLLKTANFTHTHTHTATSLCQQHIQRGLCMCAGAAQALCTTRIIVHLPHTNKIERGLESRALGVVSLRSIQVETNEYRALTLTLYIKALCVIRLQSEARTGMKLLCRGGGWANAHRGGFEVRQNF